MVVKGNLRELSAKLELPTSKNSLNLLVFQKYNIIFKFFDNRLVCRIDTAFEFLTRYTGEIKDKKGILVSQDFRDNTVSRVQNILDACIVAFK